jgi:hypothetical protein
MPGRAFGAFEADMHLRIVTMAAALAAACLAASVAAGTGAREEAVVRAAGYIAGTQEADGGFGGFGPGQTMDAIFALRAAGIDPATVTRGGVSPADFLRAHAAEMTAAGAAAKAALAARAMNLDPRAVNGVDLVARVEQAFDPATGRYGEDDFTHAIAMHGLLCTGNDVPGSAVVALRQSQLSDGGWGFEGFSDPDTTAIVLMALVAARVPASDPAVTAAVTLLRASQGSDGGWGYDPNESNTSSTAFAVQALIAAGEDPESAAYRKAGRSPIDYLLSQQAADGSFAGFDPAFATNQVLPALAGRTFCGAPMTAITRSAGDLTARVAVPLPPATGTGSRPPGASAAWLALAGALLGAGAVAAAAGRRKG